MDILKAVFELYGDCAQDGDDIYVGTTLITPAQLSAARDKAEADATVESAEQAKREFKASRDLAVSEIQVTTKSGKTFDGDEVSQNRMARAVASSSVGDTTSWVLVNNTPAIVTHDELKEALRLAGEAQTALWVTPL